MDAPDPADLSLSCPRCHERLWDHREGQWVLRNAVIKAVGGAILARCPTRGCGMDVAVPFLHLQTPAAVPAASRGRRRIVAA